MGDYYNGINKVEDDQIKLQDKVNNWWENLTKEKQFDIYKDNNPREFMSPDELGGI